MTISSKDWVRYINRLAAVNRKAADEMQSYIQKHGFGDTQEIIDFAYALATKYGEAAASAACEMYDAVAEAQGMTIPAADPAPTATYPEVAKAVNGTLKQSPEQMYRAMSRLVKQAGADTMLQNAGRDGAEFAWIPHGDTCAFCLTLGSRGWQRISKKALKNGHAEHIHSNCDCEYAIRFDGKSSVEGYDPEKLQEEYYSFEGSPDEKINAWRRKLEAPKRDEINGRRRMRYAEKIGEKQILTLNARFLNHSDKIYERTKLVKPIEGFEDVFGHGDPYSLIIKDNSEREIGNISAEKVYEWLIRSGEYKGGNIRLVACSTGKDPAVVPRYLAKKLNVLVMAPSEDANIDFLGNILLADNPNDAKMGLETGKWLIFKPDGSVEEYVNLHR